VDETDIVTGGAFADASGGKAQALFSEPGVGGREIVNPQADVIQGRASDVDSALGIEGLHQVDFHAGGAAAEDGNVLVDILFFRAVVAFDLEAEEVQPELSEARLVRGAEGDLLQSEDAKGSFHGGRLLPGEQPGPAGSRSHRKSSSGIVFENRREKPQETRLERDGRLFQAVQRARSTLFSQRGVMVNGFPGPCLSHSMRIQLVLVSLALLAPLNTCPAPDFARQATPAGAEELQLALPVFRVPSIDSDCPLLAIFVDVSDPNRAELEIVFADEDNPVPFLDYVYDADRWWGLFTLDPIPPFIFFDLSDPGGHRVADVETIQFDTSGAPSSGTIQPSSITFPGTFSDTQQFDVTIAFHHTATFNWADFEHVDGRPVIYINTWNHMFSATNNNPGMAMDEFRDVPVYRGTREEIEAMYEAVWTDFGFDL
jgi:hypothetical protein